MSKYYIINDDGQLEQRDDEGEFWWISLGLWVALATLLYLYWIILA